MNYYYLNHINNYYVANILGIKMELEEIRTLSAAESDVKGTSLVTLYLPAGHNLWLAREHINSELRTAPNIKNKSVGKAVAEALRSISYQLKTMPELPPNGLVICSGKFSIPKNINSSSYV